MDRAEDAVDAAERHLRQGEPLAAYNAANSGLERRPGHVRLRQLLALALARSGDVERANAELTALAREGLDDSETLGMLARTHKDLASRAPGDSTRATHLRAAFDLYDRAWRAARDGGDPDAAGYTGINAAAMAVLLGELDRARAIAGEVRRGGPAGADYWSEAIRGEAALILGENAAAREHYARATRLAERRYGDLGTTRRQARLLEAHLPTAGDPPSTALAIPPVMAFSGHMIDPPDRPGPRFPAGLESAVRESVRARMAAIAPAAAYGSAACGADLICLEAARELGCETHVVLPFPAAAFREASVDFAAAGWGERFERALAAADSVTIASDHRARGSTATFEYANLILTGMARLRAQVLDTGLRALAVLDAASPGAPGGTRSIVDLWKRCGIPVEVLPVVADSRQAPAASSPVDDIAPAHGIRHEMRAMLFADAVGYSKFSEDQIPLYITQFLGAVAELSRGSAHRCEHVEVSGDGLYMVFAAPVDAGRYALELSALANDTDWVARGLPAGFNLRVALHCGPVHCGRDPLTGGAIYTGPHTSRTARIEPITPPGQVYASSAFAAVAAASGDRLALSYVGCMPLAKGYGALGLYHVRGAD
jgi:tetratricopeptide (TPR) repeat protein